MHLYVVLVLNQEDEIVMVQTIMASSLPEARRMGDTIALSQPEGTTFEIWRQGRRRFTSRAAPDRLAPLGFIIGLRASRNRTKA